MGTRSMATLVETKDAKIMIDPGVNLAKKRYGLPPHPIEIEAKKQAWKDIEQCTAESDIVIITHYHYDHYNPEANVEIFRDKVLLLKHPQISINRSQMRRAEVFIRKLKKIPTEIIFCDGKEFFVGDTHILFSKPVYHGFESKLGYVIEVMVEENDERFVFTSDVQGLVRDDQLEFVMQTKPTIIFIDGPATYLLGQKISRNELEQAFKNIVLVANLPTVRKIILDHHFLRDIEWKRFVERYFDKNIKNKIITSAEYEGKAINILEAKRWALWKEK